MGGTYGVSPWSPSSSQGTAYPAESAKRPSALGLDGLGLKVLRALPPLLLDWLAALLALVEAHGPHPLGGGPGMAPYGPLDRLPPMGTRAH